MIKEYNIRYVQFLTNQGIGHCCYVTKWSRENNQLKCQVGSAYCSPKDSFSKVLAKTIAVGRLEINPQVGSVESNNTGFITNDEFILILHNIFSDKEFATIPNWARRAFDKGDYILSLRRSEHQDDSTFSLLTETLSSAKSSILNIRKLVSEKDLDSWKEALEAGLASGRRGEVAPWGDFAKFVDVEDPNFKSINPANVK